MKRFNFTVGLLAAGFALTAMPVLAGQRPNPGGSPAADRPTAVDRPATSGNVGGGGNAGSGGASTAGSAGSSVDSGGSTISSSPSGAAAASPSFSSSSHNAPMMAEPQHRRPNGGEGNHGGERAVPRGSGSSGASGTSRTGGSTTSSTAGGNNNASEPNHERAVPSWSRPRGDRPASGTAVDRTTPPVRGGDGGYYVGRYYDPFFGYGYPGYGYGLGLGLGLAFYDPYDPWGGYGYGGYGGGYGYGGGGGYYPYTPYSAGAQNPYGTEDEGSVRLKVKPRDAKVYVDGYFVGTVDSFDGVFQKLKVGAGHHRVEVKADGYDVAAFDVMITPGQTLTYQGDLKRIQ